MGNMESISGPRIVTTRRGTRRLVVLAERQDYVFVEAEDGKPLRRDGIDYNELSFHRSEVVAAPEKKG